MLSMAQARGFSGDVGGAPLRERLRAAPPAEWRGRRSDERQVQNHPTDLFSPSGEDPAIEEAIRRLGRRPGFHPHR